MLSEKNILILETRNEIYKIILKNPGLHLRELSRKTDLTLSGVRHHLHYLIQKELIITKSDRRYTRYYVSNKLSKKDKEFLNIMRQEIPRQIILLLLVEGPSEIYRDYTKEDTIDPKVLKMIHSKKELVGLVDYWKKPYDGLFQLKKHRTTIDFHLNKLINADIIEKIQTGKEIKYKVKDEFEIWQFLCNYNETLSDKKVNLMVGWGNSYIERHIDSTLEVLWDIFPHPYHA